MKDFFVSYNRADRAWAEWIAWQLEAAGWMVVFQAWDFVGGSNWVLEMDKATREAERTIAVLSPDFLTSAFTQPEWAAAFAKDATGEQRKLVPVRVRECELDGLLSQIVYLDMVGISDAGEARQRLLDGLKSRAKREVEPAFPGGTAAAAPITDEPSFPGALPPVWHVPHLRNPYFTGRNAILAALDQTLGDQGPAVLSQTLAGLGGIGKTQLALEYAYRHAAEYDVVWWLRAEQPTTLVEDLSRLAARLGLVAAEARDQSQVVAAVRDWLEHHY